ncbi:MAG TPA: M56 family metallopeptidase [Acidobacteriota bacterium]|nr:M56 family metallopeptidase [Acidobacteriota bacterium]
MQPPSAWDLVTALSAWFWPLALDHLWHATAFAVVAIAVVWILKQAPARARFWVWMLATAKFLLPTVFLASLFPGLGIPTPESAHGLFWIFQSEATAPALRSLWGGWWLLLSLLWLAGALLVWARWMSRTRRLSKRIKSEAPVTGGREYDLLQEARRRLGVHSRVRLLLTDKLESPGVWGVRQPVVVLPSHMAKGLSDPELRGVFLHELGHVLRRDNLTAQISMAACCLFWFHPLAWFLNRRLLSTREAACDDLVLANLEDARSYADGLLKVVRLRMEKEVAGLAGAAGAPLGNRLRRILSGAPAHPLTLRHRAALVCAGALLLTLTALSPAKAPCPYAQQLKLQQQQRSDGDEPSPSGDLLDGLLLKL